MIPSECTANSCLPPNTNVHLVLELLAGIFFAILFLQSGSDKIIDRRGNLDWLKGHFAKSPLAGTVPFLLTLLTLMELSAGLLSAVGITVLLLQKCDLWLFYANLAAAISLLCLFFGQRMAKDYAGAQSLVAYFIVSLIGLWLCA